jgi:hypothetical protein
MNHKFLRRLFLFGIGFTISSIFVYFFMYKNRNLPAFWPEGRVLEKIQQSSRASESDSCFYACLGWNEEELKKALDKGSVYFSKSKPRTKPCPEYIIGVPHPTLGSVRLDIQSCDSTYAVLNVFEDSDTKKKICTCKP